MHWNWYCLVTMVLRSQSINVGYKLIELVLHWSSTTTETKEDVFVRFPDASHTIVKFLILTWTLWPVCPGGTMVRAMSPLVENSVKLPRSLAVMSGHEWIWALEKDIKARPSTMMRYSPLQPFIVYCDSWSCCSCRLSFGIRNAASSHWSHVDMQMHFLAWRPLPTFTLAAHCICFHLNLIWPFLFMTTTTCTYNYNIINATVNNRTDCFTPCACTWSIIICVNGSCMVPRVDEVLITT